MKERAESIRQAGRELLRLKTAIRGEETLPEPFRDFYFELCDRALEGAKALLSPIAEEAYARERQEKGAGTLFRRFNYLLSVDCRSRGEKSEIEISVRLERGGSILCERKEFWLAYRRELLLLPSKPPKRRKREKERPT